MKIKWTLELLKKEALKYKYRNELKKNNSKAYQYACKKGLLDHICSHMSKKYNSWTVVSLKKEAKKYTNRIDFYRGNKNAYETARIRCILDKICDHMNQNFIFWSTDDLKREALKYSSRKSFERGNVRAYNTAKRKGLLDHICPHMTFRYKQYSNELLIEMAKNFNGKTEFKRRHPNEYRVACRRGILDNIFSHIKSFAGSSSSEKSLLKTIKDNYPSAKTLRSSTNIPDKPHICRFDIDIYIPELRKGIEFDGIYWHSVEGLRRSRPNWPQEDLENYHHIKDEYFKSKNIELLHINEKDWLEDKEGCLNKILEFLK